VKAIFISDAHLKRSSDERYGQLINFLTDINAGKVTSLIDPDAKSADPVYIDNLYIAGDLFDFWFCRKENIYPEFKLIIDKLVELQKTGIRIFLFEGNHDFFMGEYFHDVLEMEVFDEWANIKLDNRKILIAHGDTADKTNIVYMMFRKILRSRAFYNIQRFIPASILWGIAGLSSTVSKELNKENGDALLEKMSSFALARLREDYDVVILGHSHKPIVRHIEVAGKEKTFVALGDWIKHYSFLYYENEKFLLGYYRPR
jgi:UDP-2,3-diacylglucosamine hydrolase